MLAHIQISINEHFNRGKTRSKMPHPPINPSNFSCNTKQVGTQSVSFFSLSPNTEDKKDSQEFWVIYLCSEASEEQQSSVNTGKHIHHHGPSHNKEVTTATCSTHGTPARFYAVLQPNLLHTPYPDTTHNHTLSPPSHTHPDFRNQSEKHKAIQLFLYTNYGMF